MADRFPGGHPPEVLQEIFSHPLDFYEDVGNTVIEGMFDPEYEPHLPSTRVNQSK